MITYSKIDRKDLGELKIAIDLENDRKIYVNLLDIVFMSYIPADNLLEECPNKLVKITKSETNKVYLDVNELINSFKNMIQ